MSMSNNQYSKDDKNKGKSVNVYSPYAFANPDSKVDQTKLFATFCLGLLKLEILPKIQNSDKPFATYDNKAGVAIYLSHTKARILLKEMEAMEADPSIATSVAVDSGRRADNQGIIQISNGAEFGTTNRCVVIRKLAMDESGKIYVASSFANELHEDNYNYSIRNFNANDPTQFDKVYHNDIEWDELKDLLDSFIKAQTGAIAYSVMEQMKYTTSPINTKLDLVMEKMGIEKPSYNRNQAGTSFFSGNSGNNNSSNNTQQRTIDDINDFMN